MKFKLQNPLTTNERLQISKAGVHDGRGSLSSIINNASCAKYGLDFSPDSILMSADFLTAVFNSIIDLQHSEVIVSEEDSIYLQESSQQIASLCEHNYRTEIDVVKKGDVPEKIITNPHLLPVVLKTLVSNAFYRGNSSNIWIELEKSSFPQDSLYVPSGAESYDNFLGFHVCDGGRGFFRNKIQIPKRAPKGHGFGLYFTGLVAKCLRAPVDIQSEKGNTRVSFYHPLYLEK